MLKNLYKITAGFHRIAIFRTLIGIVRVGIILLVIWLSKTAVDCATGRIPVEVPTLIFWFALLGVGMIVDMLLARWVNYIESRSDMLMTNSITRRLYNTLLSLPPVDGKQGFHSGDMLNRLTLDVRTVSKFALSQLPTLIVLLVQILASFIFLACLNPWLALAPIVIMPVCILAAKLYYRRQRALTAEVRDSQSLMHVSIQEGLRHRLLIRTLECQPVMDRRLADIISPLNDSNREQSRLSARSSTIVRLGFVAGYLAAFGWSIFSLRAGLITFGTMTAFIQLVNRIQHPIAGLSTYIPAFIATSVALERLQEIDQASNPEVARSEAGKSSVSSSVTARRWQPPKQPVPSNPEAKPSSAEPLPRPGVRMKDVSFRYRDGDRDILSHFSYDFKPGSRTLIVGPTGVGKTTLIRLLLGILSPQSGRIEIYDDRRAREVTQADLSNFIYVPQGNSLLQGTIRENLLLANPDATDEEIAQALHTAAADFVYDLPRGLSTSCDESGGGLSEGQAQRIAIARALLRPGRILLLDEFNSALDAATAATLMERLAAARPDATIIIIAHHRDAIAPHCDGILPLPGPGWFTHLRAPAPRHEVVCRVVGGKKEGGG
ncbi:MAG: ABC transporter ATP-binding protein/permease, partial [Muribaculaceae bacterium]|nr:ABC transporter ATP-binding protein/permease [Muribaculaceae bacterium]